MKESAGWIAFLLIIVGTLGLLANEFLFDWGTVATIGFGVSNLIGLMMLGCTLFRGGSGRNA